MIDGTKDVDISLASLSRSNLTNLEFYAIFDADMQGLPLFSTLVNDLPQEDKIDSDTD